jgi:AmmeMemoRadiSam system protein B
MDLVSRLLYYDDMNRASREMIDNEHGQLVHMPYIEHYFPDTKVLSIVIKELRDDEGITRAVEEIYSEVKDFNILFIASIDFSHYLSLESANEKDEFTRDYLTNNNTYTMMHLSNDYIDSPSTYKMFIEFLNRQNETKTLITNHSNSAIIMEDVRMTETTSYFQVIFDEKSY